MALHEELDDEGSDVDLDSSRPDGVGSSGGLGSGAAGKLAGFGNVPKFRPDGSFPLTIGKVMWHAASTTVFIALLATSTTAPTSPFALGLGKGLHLSEGSSILTNGISGRPGLLTRMTGKRLRSVTSGI